MTATVADTAGQLVNSVSSLPPLPGTAQEILACFGDAFIDADKVTAVVEGDPGICARLLGLSNSAYFGLAEPVNHIGEAISRVLGVDTVRSLVLAMAIQRSFQSHRCPAFDCTRFWRQALKTAECCKKVAAIDPEADESVRDLAYSAGLCHNLGLMALAHLEPVRTSAVLKAHAADENQDLSAQFMQEFGLDHRVLTAELARNWALPEAMVAAYESRAYSDLQAEHRLAIVVAIGALTVKNAEQEQATEHPAALRRLAVEFGAEPQVLQDLAHLGDRQVARVESLAGNMAG